MTKTYRPGTKTPRLRLPTRVPDRVGPLPLLEQLEQGDDVLAGARAAWHGARGAAVLPSRPACDAGVGRSVAVVVLFVLAAAGLAVLNAAIATTPAVAARRHRRERCCKQKRDERGPVYPRRLLDELKHARVMPTRGR